MPVARRLGATHIGVLFLLALLCLPLVLGAHHHQPDGLGVGRAGCSICAVTADAPALSSPAPPALALALLGVVRSPATAPAAPRRELRPEGARAPPARIAGMLA